MTSHKPLVLVLLIAAPFALTLSCARTGQRTATSGARPSKATTLATADPKPTTASKAGVADNPTTRSGRGEPDLDDFSRPAAWVYIDGREGKFTESQGQPAPQWVIEGAVTSSPTFRVEAYSPLLGDARDFSCVLSTVTSADGSEIGYAMQAVAGTFRTGRDYPLLQPGTNFTIRNRTSGDVVTEIAPLAPGTYLIAAAVKNRSTKREGLAITHFTVSEETP